MYNLLVTKHHILKKHLFELFLLLLICLYAVLALFAKKFPYFPLDLFITRNIQDITIPGFANVMYVLTFLGNPIPGILSVFTIVIFFIFTRQISTAFFLLISVGGNYIISVFFKSLISRPRPSSELIQQLSPHPLLDSFPSGHVLFFIGFYGFLLFLSLREIKNRTIKFVTVTIFAIMIGFIGVSRIYVGAHWFSDTIGAYLIGTVWLLIMVHFYKKQKKKIEILNKMQ